MNYTVTTADRDTHIKIVSVALTISIVIAWFAISMFG